MEDAPETVASNPSPSQISVISADTSRSVLPLSSYIKQLIDISSEPPIAMLIKPLTAPLSSLGSVIPMVSSSGISLSCS